jgi:hypothetical protein
MLQRKRKYENIAISVESENILFEVKLAYLPY